MRRFPNATSILPFIFGLLLSGAWGPASAQPLTLNLPGGGLNQGTSPAVAVTLASNYSPTFIQFYAAFQNVPSGYAITNTTYKGWCVDAFAGFGTNPTYYLISTYDTSTLNSSNPPGGGNLQNTNWNAVNYVINNPPTTATNPTWVEQQVIWNLLTGAYLTNAYGGTYYPSPNGGPLALSPGDTTIANNLYNTALTQTSFVPGPGQKVAVLLQVDGNHPDTGTESTYIVSQNGINTSAPPLNAGSNGGLNGQPNNYQEIIIEVPVYGPPAANCVSITAVQGVPITPAQMTATGGTGTGYTFSATGLPPGLTMSSNGVIYGTPTQSGTFNYTVTIKDSAGDTGTVNCSVTVAPQVSGTCLTINAVQGVPISVGPMTATGGTGTGYTFSATGLPPGLTMSSNGVISGTPTQSGTFNYTVTIKDSAGDTGTVNCAVTVSSKCHAECVSITAYEGVPITPVTLQGDGGSGGPYTFSATGLPPGLTISTSGTISGTPTQSGTFNYTVTIKDRAGHISTVDCSVTVLPPPASSMIASGDTATIGFWHNQNGQALIDSMNGSPTSTALGNWLATNFPYLYGPQSPNDLTNQSNTAVAALFLKFFDVKGPKTYAQIMAGALAAYVTSTNLAGGNYASQYGFATSTGGVGGYGFNVGSDGTAIGLSNNTVYSVYQLLQQANLDLENGTFNANAFNDIFDGINTKGDIQ